MFRFCPDLAPESDGIEELVDACQLALLFICQGSALQKPLIGSSSGIVDLVHPGSMSALPYELKYWLEEVNLETNMM